LLRLPGNGDSGQQGFSVSRTLQGSAYVWRCVHQLSLPTAETHCTRKVKLSVCGLGQSVQGDAGIVVLVGGLDWRLRAAGYAESITTPDATTNIDVGNRTIMSTHHKSSPTARTEFTQVKNHSFQPSSEALRSRQVMFCSLLSSWKRPPCVMNRWTSRNRISCGCSSHMWPWAGVSTRKEKVAIPRKTVTMPSIKIIHR
jgi:hypothetical protein